MRTLLSTLVLAAAMTGPLSFVHAAESDPQPDKSAYTLFNPTPTSALRDLDTDRPDKTESPITVDAGHLQLEADFFVYSRDHRNADHLTSVALSIAPTNLRLGLTNNLEIGLIVESYNWQRDHDRTTLATDHTEGFGDTTLRLKYNLIGNDSGPIALALFPFIKFPSNSIPGQNKNVEGGLILPFAMDLPAEWSLGAMTEFDALRDDDRNQYHALFINSITVSHAIVGNLSGFVEFYSEISSRGAGQWVGTVDGGFKYLITPNIQLDCGINLGVTKAAPDFELFSGISVRF